jgi:cystathionine beta-synthase
MEVYDSILELVGNTPLVRLNKVSKDTPATILVKLESMNPGGSVKDRVGISMLEDAEKRGLLSPGATIIEPTSGNTGMGLAMCAAVRGYKMIFTMPDKMSEEKRNLLRAFGAKIVITPTAVAHDSPENYIQVAEKLNKETPNSFMPNQYRNPANPQVHYRTTGPEIWKQTEGHIDTFVCGVGTGGTITGTGRYLKERKKTIRIVGADPEGSIFYDRFHGHREEARTYKVEGIGEDFMPDTLDMSVIDDIVRVSDKEAFHMARRLAREEGILVGGSGGAAVSAGLKAAKNLDKGKIVVALLPDTGRNYLSKLFSDEWMRSQGMLAQSDSP